MTPDTPHSLIEIRPDVASNRLLADLVPPRHFAEASFDSYRANAAHPSQQAAVDRLRAIAAQIQAPAARGLSGLLRRKSTPPAAYLDGGFGVGKTHLLAALAHQVGRENAAYGTFVEYTNLVGALGFQATVTALSARRVVCIDEFELDDPGDTVLMSRLLRELADAGVALVATSNTLPESLGEGRFAAEDFLREIQALSARFEVLRIDGEDYRHREVATTTIGLSDDAVDYAVAALLRSANPPALTLDSFDAVLAHLVTVHPSRYGALLDGIRVVALTGVHQITDQSSALRLVVLVDRLYDQDVPVLLGTGEDLPVFTDVMLRGGYRKKYYRALSRLGALAQDGHDLLSGIVDDRGASQHQD